MKRPSLQFYPADWRNNAKLRRCSWAARGAWMDILGLLHDSDEYGVLRWNLREFAQAIGAPIALVNELVSKGVLKGCDAGTCEPYVYTPRHAGEDGKPETLVPAIEGPVWYSSRLVRDEHVRQRRGSSTRFSSGQKMVPMPSPKEGIGDGASTTSTSASASASLAKIDAGAAQAKIPDWLSTIPAWEAFVRHRREIGKPLKPTALKAMVVKLEAMQASGENVAEALENSITSGWTGVFSPKGGGRRGKEYAASRTKQNIREIEEELQNAH